MVGLHTYF